MIKITADRMIDLSDNELIAKDIKTVPCYINMGNQSYFDLVDVFPKDIFKYLFDTGLTAKTAAVSSLVYQDFFQPIVDNGDQVIHFSCSSGISALNANAITAAKKFSGNVKIIDSLTLGNGIALLALYAQKLISDGCSFDEVYSKSLARVPQVQASFLLDTLLCLYKGGRCSSFQYYGANILRIKPTIHMDGEGKMKIREKRRGKLEFSIKSYIKDTFTKFPNPDLCSIYIEESTPNAEIRALITEEIKKYYDFKNIFFNETSCNCAIHCGEKTVGMFYFKDVAENAVY